MKYESPLKYFRDQNKNPDEEKKHNPNWRDEELSGEDLSRESDEASKIERMGSFAEKYREVVDIIKNADLKTEFAGDKAEKAIIKKRKELIIEFLGNILNDIKNYLTQVNYLQLQKIASYDDISKYQSAIRESDGLRRTYHNKMISDIKIAVRLINTNFNADFPDNLRLAEESKMADRRGVGETDLKNKLAEREYYNFPYPAGVFIDFSRMPKDPQGEREYIASWALNMYADLTELETKINS